MKLFKCLSILLGVIAVGAGLSAQPIKEVWDIQCDNVGMVWDYDMTADGSNVYIADFLPTNGTLVKAYNKETGALLWTKQWTNIANHGGIYADAGSVYVVSSKETPYSLYMARLDCSNQTILWENDYNTSSDPIYGNDAVVRGAYAYAVGAISGAGGMDFFILERNKETGAKTWDWQFNEDHNEIGEAIGADSRGIYATGYQKSLNTPWTINIPIADPNIGWVPDWKETYTTGQPYTYVENIAVDTAGDIFVVGGTYDNANTQAIIIKYDNAGNVKWFKTFQSGGSGIFKCAAADDQGNLFVGGKAASSGVIAKYTSEGDRVSLFYKYNSIEALCWKDGYLYAVASYNDGSQYYTHLIKYQDLNAVEEPSSEPSSGPSSPSSLNLEVSGKSISYSIPATCNVSLKLYDASGQLVSSLFEGTSSAGAHTLDINTSSLARGCYFVRLAAGSESVSRKVIVK